MAECKSEGPYASLIVANRHLLFALVVLSASCAQRPMVPYTTEEPPNITIPIAHAGVVDRRARFREFVCAVLEARRDELPDVRPCDEVLARVAGEHPGSGDGVDLGVVDRRLVAAVVPGIGYACFAEWLESPDIAREHLARFGFDRVVVPVDALSSSEQNARQIREWVTAWVLENPDTDLVLIGYSKGAVDALEAVVRCPSVRESVAAVVSVAGAVGGSPLANVAHQSQLQLLTRWPGAECTEGDGGGLDSLKPSVRRAWLSANPLPPTVPYYSLVTFPEPARISSVLKSSYKKLARIDGRNDSQVIYRDQIIPGSTLAGFLNADHWAVAVPVARSHRFLGSTFVDQNDFPREAVVEALLRFLREDLDARRAVE